MRMLAINERKMWYANYIGRQAVVDENGDETGDYEVKYTAPVQFSATLSPGRGTSGPGGYVHPDIYGIKSDSDRRIITNDLSIPVTETTLIWLKEPSLLQDGSADPTTADYQVAAKPSDGKNFLSIYITLRVKSDEED